MIQRMLYTFGKTERRAILAISSAIITLALIYLVRHNRTFVHIDAIAHVNKGRGLWDNATPGLKQLGSNWLPLQHLLIAPLTISDTLWSTGLAGSVISAGCFIGTAWFLFGTAARWTGSSIAGWMAFLLFALNPRLIYFFTTPMTEPLMILCAAGLVYYLIEWAQTERWQAFAMASLMAFAGTLIRYEGWAIAAFSIPIVFVITRTRRLAWTIIFAGAAVLGPMLWMIYNMVYFEDPLIFALGPGSARDYAESYFLRTGKHFPTAGKLFDSLTTYWTDVAYCVNPLVLALGVTGVCFVWLMWRDGRWRPALIVIAVALASFSFYVYNLYANMVPVMLPGLVEGEAGSIYNVRYGTVMAATLPVLAGVAVFLVFQRAERRRTFAFALVALMFFPDPIPDASEEAPPEQLTNNLFYTEGIHNQSFWLPPFVEVAHRLKSDIDADHDDSHFILTNSRVVHPVVWATGIHMKRFIYEMNSARWHRNLVAIDPGIRWVITEEGDDLWKIHSKTLQRDWTDVAHASTPSTGVVHLYRRRDPDSL
jgi:hypothetical protein